MKQISNWPPLLLNLLVLPGLGHWMIGKQWRGTFFMLISLLLLLGGLFRFIAVFFAVANTLPTTRAPHLNPVPILQKTWHSDSTILLTFLGLLIFVWLLAFLDLWREIKKEGKSSHSL